VGLRGGVLATQGGLCISSSGQNPPFGAHSRESGVEEYCRQALDIARRQGAKSRELPAALSLSWLWQQGKRDVARQLLAPVYGWFTEGFDTADLQEAKVMLEELS
jgi:predicted ATPase